MESFSGITVCAAEEGPAPALLFAVTLQEYWTPAVRLPTVMGEVLPVAVRVACPAAEQDAV